MNRHDDLSYNDKITTQFQNTYAQTVNISSFQQRGTQSTLSQTSLSSQTDFANGQDLLQVKSQTQKNLMINSPKENISAFNHKSQIYINRSKQQVNPSLLPAREKNKSEILQQKRQKLTQNQDNITELIEKNNQKIQDQCQKSIKENEDQRLKSRFLIKKPKKQRQLGIFNQTREKIQLNKQINNISSTEIVDKDCLKQAFIILSLKITHITLTLAHFLLVFAVEFLLNFFFTLFGSSIVHNSQQNTNIVLPENKVFEQIQQCLSQIQKQISQIQDSKQFTQTQQDPQKLVKFIYEKKLQSQQRQKLRNIKVKMVIVQNLHTNEIITQENPSRFLNNKSKIKYQGTKNQIPTFLQRVCSQMNKLKRPNIINFTFLNQITKKKTIEIPIQCNLELALKIQYLLESASFAKKEYISFLLFLDQLFVFQLPDLKNLTCKDIKQLQSTGKVEFEDKQQILCQKNKLTQIVQTAKRKYYVVYYEKTKQIQRGEIIFQLKNNQQIRRTFWIFQRIKEGRYIWRNLNPVDMVSLSTLLIFITLPKFKNDVNCPSITINLGHGDQNGQSAFEAQNTKLVDQNLQFILKKILLFIAQSKYEFKILQNNEYRYLNLNITKQNLSSKFYINANNLQNPNKYPQNCQHTIDFYCNAAKAAVLGKNLGFKDDKNMHEDKKFLSKNEAEIELIFKDKLQIIQKNINWIGKKQKIKIKKQTLKNQNTKYKIYLMNQNKNNKIFVNYLKLLNDQQKIIIYMALNMKKWGKVIIQQLKSI